ncbi:M48 family metalloprotease [Paraliomyxa miuraensis]|uniref:M48 family metalloprotease n=1 Tax=Paraliomyxa miuraensis TaxID=376150 RepID=UPI0022586EF5|nr:M48 family metalloprotease [Paraliomyxa miuraensis]MCX4239500.1 M48 family metalloprotease [Paraliomyxa miuraensis]
MAAWLVGALLVGGCSFNQATGRLQLTAVSESEEIQLGQENDAEVVAALGLYEDERLSSLVEEVGAKLAAQSERPRLPWTFRVLDDPTVNAFALPGGYVYVTRGLLVHLRSTDELAAVLGHELGHVTARHGVIQLRKSRVAAASVGLFRVVDPNLRHVGGIAASTAGLALLKYSRDDEYEADSLGLRYVGRAGFEPAATVSVFDVLVGVGKVEHAQRVPSWLSTHPDPQARRTRVASMAKGEPPAADPEYLARLDGVLYGMDPRDGYIVGETFVHPKQGYAIDLPAGWQASHDGPRAMAISEDEAALLVLLPFEAESAEAALDDFFADGSMQRGETWSGTVGGFSVVSAGFSAASSDASLMGLLAFIDYGEQVIAVVALGPVEGWEARSEVVARSFASFRRAAPALAGVEPMRVKLLTLEDAATLLQVQERAPSAIDLPRLALLNTIEDPTASLPAGTVIKRVQGIDPRTRTTQPSTPPPAHSPG